MDTAYLNNLFLAYATNSISKTEFSELMGLIAEAKEDAELAAFMEKVWNSHELSQSFTELQSALLYERIINDRRFVPSAPKIPALQVAEPKGKVIFFNGWYLQAIAASVIILLSAGLLFYILDQGEQSVDEIAYTKDDIVAGGDKAVLIMANGQKVQLNDAIYQVAEQKEKINGAPVYNSIVTPPGGQYQVRLPDGTRVWLNAASSLQFPLSFSEKTRTVKLEGEAYFEVAHNKEQPFLVEAADQQLKVLGTHFNVEAYTNEPAVKTTLLEGSVLIRNTRAVQLGTASLEPGQQATLDGKKISVYEADLETAMAWKNGYFIFKDEDMPSIMRKIERWYNVEVVYPEELKHVHFEGTISRFRNVSELLRKFELTGRVHFKIEGRRITAMP